MPTENTNVESKRLANNSGEDADNTYSCSGKDGVVKGSNKVDTLEEVEHRALISRITTIMNNMQERLKLAFILAGILQEENKSFSKFLTEPEISSIRNLCDKHLHRTKLLNEAKIDHVTTIDKDVTTALDTLNKHAKIMKNFSNFEQDFPETYNKFLVAFSELRKLTEIRINTSAKSEVRKEKMLHKTYHENERLNLKIAAIKAQIRQRDVSMQWKIAGKQALVQAYKRDLTAKKWSNSILVKLEVTGANARMTTIYAKSEERQQELREEAEEAKVTYEQLLQDNIRVDKALREKKSQILAQLHAWIKKYDIDIGERTAEVERLEAELAEKTKDFDKFMKLYDVQEEEYKMIIAMRDAEEKQKQEERMILFMMNRAAKIIQTKWREYMQKKKKKGKKGGKKAKK